MQVKICGLTRAADAAVAAAAGATFGGVILAPDSPRTIDPARAGEIFAGTTLRRCAVFVDESADRILELSAELGLDVVQLHGDEPPEAAATIRERAGPAVWKAIRPRSGDEFLEAARRYGSSVDALLIDGWSANARGGTGVRFPWEEVAYHRARLDPTLRLVAAGGLNPHNVAELVTIVAPDVVDVSSGVESEPGIKDHDSIRRFVAAATGAAINRGVD